MVVADGLVWVEMADGALAAFDTATGTPRWAYDGPHAVTSRLVAARGHDVYLHDNSGGVLVAVTVG
jgi:outer membrane protein assembly factor BamB